MKRRTLFTLFIAALVMSLAHAAMSFDARKSSVTITAKQMNVPVSAKFKSVHATIDYHPNALNKSTAQVDIDINSFDLGDADINREVLKKDWFNAAQFPKATFVSTAFTQAGKDKLSVSGKLTIKGTTLDVNFPVTISQQNNSTLFDGKLPIKRLAFHVGDGEWNDTSMVSDDVVIQFHLVTH